MQISVPLQMAGLEQQFKSDVDLKDFRISVYPELRVDGEDLASLQVTAVVGQPRTREPGPDALGLAVHEGVESIAASVAGLGTAHVAFIQRHPVELRFERRFAQAQALLDARLLVEETEGLVGAECRDCLIGSLAQPLQ